MDNTDAKIDLGEVTVADDAGAGRFEAKLEGRVVALAAYRLDGDEIVFTHTEVPPELEGQGLAAKVVKAALDEARTRDLKVVPMCPYVRTYVMRHPAYLDLVPPNWKQELGL